MAKAKDAQRAKLYRAEREVFTFHPDRVLASFPGATVGQLKWGQIVTLDQAQNLQDRIGSNKHLTRRWRNGREAKAVARLSPRRNGAVSCGGRILYGPRSLVDWVVLHEMAHEINRDAYRHAVNAGRGDKTVRIIGGNDRHYHASHGWRFCAIYLHIVRLYIGAEAAAALKAAYDRNKVRYKEPRAPRQLNDEQKAAMIERLAKAREKARTNRIAKSLP